MGIAELFLIAVGLSMDAFAVSVCKGLAMKKCTWKKAGIVGLYFGVFQAGMPTIGYLLGVQFQDIITSVDHWIAFILLGIIGANMIREAMGSCDECQEHDDSLDVRTMTGLAVATSIDALAVGVTFASGRHYSGGEFYRSNYLFDFFRRSQNRQCIWSQIQEESRDYRRRDFNSFRCENPN